MRASGSVRVPAFDALSARPAGTFAGSPVGGTLGSTLKVVRPEMELGEIDPVKAPPDTAPHRETRRGSADRSGPRPSRSPVAGFGSADTGRIFVRTDPGPPASAILFSSL